METEEQNISMDSLSEKELERRRKISEARKRYLEEKRRAGYEKYIKKKRKQIAKRKEKEAKKKEDEKLKKQQEREEKKLIKKIKKRKVGRPKKRGPKKKRKYKSKKIKIDGRKTTKNKQTKDYKIVVCHNGRQVEYIESFKLISDAYKVWNELLKANDNIVFSREITNDGKVLKNSIDEYLLLEKNRHGDKKDIPQRNEFGKIVDVTTNSNRWVIIDKERKLVEETFWVYGYHPRLDRKTYPWIYSEIVLDGINGKHDYKRIIQYKNKIVIKNDNLDLDIIFCKSIGEAIRFYNKLEESVKKDKIKTIFFLGSYDKISEKRRKLEEELMEYTGMPKLKIQMPTTKYCRLR